MTDIQTAIQAVLNGRDLSAEDMRGVVREIMTGQCSDAQIAGFLVSLRAKGETAQEITAAASVMRELATEVSVSERPLIDTCGTGGDGAGTFNISTTVAFVVAAAGAYVAKHGNRSVSGRSGSADVLEAVGVRLQITPDEVVRCISEIGVGFLFAPYYHEAMRHAAAVRRELGVRTLFNLLGPLTNPARATHQVLGVFSGAWLEILATVLRELGVTRAMVVHADDGLDEISVGAPTRVAELRDGRIKTYTINPEQFDLAQADLGELSIAGVDDSVRIMHSVLDNEASAARDVVVLNAGAAIYTAGIEETLADGMVRAQALIANGKARDKLNALINLTQTF